MKKKKTTLERVSNVWENDLVTVCRGEKEYFFEIGQETTNDIGEAVAIMMRYKNLWNDSIWNTEVKNINTEDITPLKTLYWLSGGDAEWSSLEHYSKPWHEIALTFQEEYGMLICMIISKAKTLRDIREGFIKYLNLPTLYDFAVQQELVY